MYFKLINIALFLLMPSPVFSQVGITETTGRSQSKSTFSYRITSTFQTQSSVEGTNVTGTANADVTLAPGGYITNKIGDDRGNASATFNASPNGSSVQLEGVTGENLHVDAGYHVVGMKAPDAPDISIVKDEA